MQTVDEKISKKVNLETTKHSRLRIVFAFVERKNTCFWRVKTEKQSILHSMLHYALYNQNSLLSHLPTLNNGTITGKKAANPYFVCFSFITIIHLWILFATLQSTYIYETNQNFNNY